MSKKAELLALAKRVDQAKEQDNHLDVLIEIALFVEDAGYYSVRANEAGTKVIYTSRSGEDVTFWAEDWTLTPTHRYNTAAALRAHADLVETACS